MDKYSAVIVDSRITDLFNIVLDNFYSKLDDRWDFIIYTTNNNFNFVKDLINSTFANQKNRTTIIKLNINHINIKTYSKLLISNDFYKNIPTEIFLIFQLDSLLSDIYYNIIYDYMKYDYIGSPFYYNNNIYVGCGGLSIRKKSKMIEIINDYNYYYKNNDLPEDVYFCNYHSINKAPVEEALSFCSGAYFHPFSVGMHQTFKYITEEQLQIIEKHIPKIRKVVYKYDLISLMIYNNTDYYLINAYI